MARSLDPVPLQSILTALPTSVEPEPEPTRNHHEVHAYPERGAKAWLVVLGAWCAMVPPIGLVNSMGVLYAWVGHHQLENYSESAVGWIFSIHGFFLYIGSSQLGSVFDKYGVKPLVVAGSIGYFISIMSLSFCTEYYQFVLAFGILGGVSASCLFTPSVCAVGHWFSKRRAFATGIAYTSGSLGGVVFPLLFLYLAPRIGYPWTMRIIGFVSGTMFMAACALLNTRLAPDTTAGLALDLKALRDPLFALTTLAVFLVEFAVFIPLTYISSFAIHAGIEPQEAYLLIAFLNIGSIPGRILPGYFADRFGRFNVMIVTTCCCSVCIFGLWQFCGSNSAAITAFSILFGFWSGASISLTPVCVAQICRIEDYGKRNGTAYSLSSFAALIGVPIAGALVDANGGDYNELILFGGSLYAATMLAFLSAKFMLKSTGIHVGS
ncbi:monocarboxylate transporter [Xylariales sp. PMI_506]|nr:monocarboxylate transporter [Xylariales sp. PMI_506]